MKKMVKKLFAAALSTTVVFSMIMPMNISAATTTVMDEDFTTVENLDGWTYSNTKDNNTKESTFKLDNSMLKVYSGIKDNGVDRLTKQFTPINTGDTLEITGTLSVIRPDDNSGQNVALRIGNGNHNWSLLQLSNNGATQRLSAAGADTNEDNGYRASQIKKDFNLTNLSDPWGKKGFEFIAGKDINYSAALAPSESGYTLTVTLGDYQVEPLSVTLTTEEAISLDRIYFSSGANSTGNRAAAIQVKNLKMVREVYEKPLLAFGDEILYNNDGVRMDEDFTTWTGTSAIVTADNADYTRGAKWAYSNTKGNATQASTFTIENNALKVCSGIKDNGVDSLTKKFNPINAGDTLKITGILSVIRPDDNSGQNVALRIGNGNHNWSLLQLSNNGATQSLSAAGMDTNEDNGYRASQIKQNFDLTNLKDSWGKKGFEFIAGKDINYSAELAPSEDGYTLTVSLGDYQVTPLSIALTTAEATSLDRIYFTSGANSTSNRKAAIKAKNLKVEAIGTKTGLENGENTLYLPVKNLNGENANFTVVAALCEADGTKKSFKIVPCENLTDYTKNLAVNMTVDNKDNQYVKIFVFDNMENIIPLTGAKTTK